MAQTGLTLPRVVPRAEWVVARKGLLAKEKELTRHRDAVNAERRRLPMVEVQKAYVFEGPDGKANLLDLFNGRRQLIVYHFMFDPSWDEGCPSCSTYARGTDLLVGTYNYLDLTPLGRQEDWEEPPGRSDGPFMHWIRHHDKYGESEGVAGAAPHIAPQESDACCNSHA